MKTKLLLAPGLWILSSTLSLAALFTTFTNPTPASSDWFGRAVAGVGADKVLVGAYGDDTGAANAGAAYLFGTNGTLLSTFTNPTPAASDSFGCAVAAVGVDNVLVGAYGDNAGATQAGAAYLFSTNGTLLTTFTNPTPAASDIFGVAVAAVGTDKVLISAYRDDTGATDAGAAYLFSTNGTLLTTFTNPTPAAGDFFGRAVAAVGTDKVLIGAYQDDTGATDTGAAYLFSTGGTLLITFTNPTPAAFDSFGFAVTAVGTDKVLVGANGDNTGAAYAGAAYLFSTNGALLTTFTNPAPAASDSFGFAVAGVGTDKVLIGTPWDDIGAADAGAAYLFSTSGTLLTTFTNPTPATGDNAGYAVGVVGGKMPFIGASGNDTGAADAGAAYLFSAYTGPPSVSTLPASGLASSNATLVGLVSPNGSATTAWFEWGQTTSYGYSSATTNSESADEAMNFQAVLTGLSPGQIYHYRAVATNSAGVTFGSDQSFTTPLLIVATLNDGGPGSLRQAIADATPGTLIQVPLTGTITLTSGELVITNDLTMIGPGATNLAISGNLSSRVFVITNTTTVSISDLTIRDGHAPDGVDGTNGISGEDGQSGGGFYNRGTLTLTRCVVTGSSAGNGGSGGAGSSAGGMSGSGGRGARGGSGGLGGGLYNGGTLTLNECTLSGNSAGTGGGGGGGGSGGIFGGSGGAGGDGGDGGYGGGIFSSESYSSLVLNNCTFSGNSAGNGGYGGHGGITYPASSGPWGLGGPGGSGGGIYTYYGYQTLHNCTLSSNAAGLRGGAGYTQGSDGSGGGIAGSAELWNTLVALNTPTNSSSDVWGMFTSLGHNLIGNTTGSSGFGTNGDVLNLNPLLGPLADNGGPTFTHALLPGSPALEAGDDAVLLSPYDLATDQRGQPRKVGYHVDIGAVERSVPGVTPPVATTAGAWVTATNPVTGALTAFLHGSVSAGGAAFCTACLEYGLTTSYGGFAGLTNVSYGAGLTPIGDFVSGLAAGLPFHYRVVASNVVGITYGADLVLATRPLLPPGDANGDGVVDQTELDAVLQNYWPNSPWLQMTNLAGLGGSNVIFTLTNATAGTFTVEFTTNLLDWQYLGPAEPFYHFLDTNAPAVPQRFYRLRWP